MLKLITLKKHVESLGFCNPEHAEAIFESGAMEIACSEAGGGLELYRLSYTGVIALEGARGDLRDLLAHVAVWLIGNGGDPDRNRLVGWEGDPNDDHTSDIDLRFELEEPVGYVPAEPGYAGNDKVTVNGQDWKRGSAVPDVADSFTIQGLSA